MARERCNYELIVEEYFGIKKDIERQAVMADFNSAVDLVCAAHQKWAASLPINSMHTQPEEREEMVRIAGEAFDAGMEHEYEKHFGAVPPLSPNKEQYLSQIK